MLMNLISGHRVGPGYLSPSDVHLTDICHALAQINRFTGHVYHPYSVAAHTLVLYDWARKMPNPSHRELLLEVLLHDAHEAYVGDVARPLKMALGETYELLERQAQGAVRASFQLPHQPGPAYDRVVELDRALGWFELLSLGHREARRLPQVLAAPWLDVADVSVPPIISYASAPWTETRDRLEECILREAAILQEG